MIEFFNVQLLYGSLVSDDTPRMMMIEFFNVQLLYASLVSDDTPVPLGDNTTSQIIILSNDNSNGLVNFPSNT